MDDLVPVVSMILNKIHHINYSERFWRIIALPYLSAIISSSHILENEKPLIRRVYDVYENRINSSIQSILYGFIRNNVRAIKFLFKKRDFTNKLKNSNNIGIGFQPDDSIKNEIDIILDARYEIQPPIRLVHKRVIEFEIPEEMNGFSKRFIENIIKSLPYTLLDDFFSILNSIELYRPDEKVFHVLTFENFYMRVLVAKYVENGAKLFYYQHGGYYGEFNHHNAHYNESIISDRFITWGWRMLEKDFPGKAYKCENFSRVYTKKENPRFDYLIVYPLIQKSNAEKYQDITRLLVSMANNSKKIVIRPRPTSAFNRRGFFRKFSKNGIIIDSGYKPIVELINESKLVIQLTYPSTNMLECLYVDHPCVALLSEFVPSDNFRPFFDFFKDKGVFHKSIDSMIEFLKVTEINSWWKNIISDPVYSNFKKQFIAHFD